ncbi:MAG: DUF115 domain-containing protein [bacterium]|nr:DUF115 domain-containing protein [bacterium]
MTQTYFDVNAAALERRDPELAQRIRETSLSSLPVEVVASRTNVPAVRLTPPGGGSPIALCSAYDPWREAQRWADTVQINHPTNVIVLGVGVGYHVLALLKARDADIRFLIVIERDPRIFRLAMSALDLRPLIAREGVQFIVGAEPAEIPELIGEKRTDIILHNCKITPHDPSMRVYGSYYDEARRKILDALAFDEINLRTTFESQGRNQFNIYMNLPAMFRGYALKPLEGLFRGVPAVVCAAGPSLDKNVRELHALNDRAVLIIVDTAQATFKRLGIEPFAVVTGDPTPLNFSHFEKIDSLGEAFLAFHPEVNHQITHKFLYHPWLLPLFDGDSELLDHVMDATETYGVCPREMNVGHLAFNLAEMMGCSPIVLAGFDFAFPKRGGTTHAALAAVSRTVAPMKEDGEVRIGGKEGKAPEETGKMLLVPGYDGEPVPTTAPFQQYILALEKHIARTEAVVIDATEGGARFEGALQMPLRQALETRLGEPGVAQKWNAFRATKPSPCLETVLARQQEVIDALRLARSRCDDLAADLRRWAELLKKSELEPALVESEWSDFDRKWIEMVGDPLLNAGLDTAVQYIYFRRQRHTKPKDGAPRSFLQCMYDKYDGIISEMTGLLDHFIHCVELSVQALRQSAKEHRS